MKVERMVCMKDKKKKLDPKRWFYKDGKTRITLLKYYVAIKDKKLCSELEIYVDSQVALTLKFINKRQAMAFTEDVINCTYSLEKIENEYINYINGSKWYDEIVENEGRLDVIESILSEIVDLDNKITNEYYKALVKKSNIIDSDLYSKEEINNYNVYLNHLTEQYKRLSRLESKFKRKIESTNKDLSIKELEEKPRILSKSNTKKNKK